MTTTGLRHGLGDLISAGGRAVSRYTGTVLAVFIVQSLIAAACMLGITFVFVQAFAHLPMFDDAVDGDLVAVLWIARYHTPSFVAAGGIVFATIVLWQLVSWFLAGGLYGVFAQRPETRSETARMFGASGAATYLAYARLAACSLPGWMLVFVVFRVTTNTIASRLDTALSIGDLVGPIAFVLVPTLLLLHFFWTVTDYARVELTLRRETHDPSAVMTYFRSLAYVLRRPLTLVHAGFGWLAFLIVTLAYMFIAQGHPMYGAEGAVTLFVARSGVSLLRLTIHVGVMAGQLELGRTRPLPPRRAGSKVDDKD